MINLPDDFVKRIHEQLKDEADDFLESYNRDHEKSLRINIRKNKAGIVPFVKDIAARVYNDSLGNDIYEKARVKWEKKGLYYQEASEMSEDEATEADNTRLILKEPGKSPLHAAGAYYIQEASAMLPVTLLNIDSVEDAKPLKVLDLCAAPGGKSTQIADYMNGRGLLISNEIISSRAKILSENIERMAVTNAMVISEDPLNLAPRFPYYFDRILVDAPCSGEGMFRKHPQVCDEWSLENVSICAERQKYILDCASKMLDMSGRIVYSTCTFAPEEDEAVIDDFLENHPEFIRASQYIRIFPNRERGEGHFAAVLERRDKVMSKYGLKSRHTGKIVDSVQLNILTSFIKDNLKSCSLLGITDTDTINKGMTKEVKDRLLMFGDNIYLGPEYMPDIKGLSVLRPGLHLGTITKGRFEPAHAFALALTQEEVKRVYDTGCFSAEVSAYLRGLTLNADIPNGWCLVCTEGMSIGWAKGVNGILKNHYPKGLRIQG